MSVERAKAALEAARKRNRERMPTVAAWVDMTKKTFPGARVVWAKENGIEVGGAKI